MALHRELLFSELYKIMVNKDMLVGVRGGDPPWIRPCLESESDKKIRLLLHAESADSLRLRHRLRNPG